MKVSYDENEDILWMRFGKREGVIESEEVEPGVDIEYNDNDEIVGIELRGAMRFIADAMASQVLERRLSKSLNASAD